jgi:hypothetical protein
LEPEEHRVAGMSFLLDDEATGEVEPRLQPLSCVEITKLK